jgi:AcrR family transcriptional regulator
MLPSPLRKGPCGARNNGSGFEESETMNKRAYAEPDNDMPTKRLPAPKHLVKAALELFAERHFDSVTIKDIGRAAKLNSAMIYYYYKDKQDLFHAAIESAIEDAFELFDRHCRSDAHKSAADAIFNWFDVHATLHTQLRNVVKISVDCKGIIGIPGASEPIIRFYKHESEILENLVRQGIAEGIFREVDPQAVATLISTSLDGVMARSFILSDFELLKTIDDFKQVLWLYLRYPAQNAKSVAERGKPSREPRKKGGKRDRRRNPSGR